MANITLKRGDTRPNIVRNLVQTVDGTEVAIDLNDVTSVTLKLKAQTGSSTTTVACTVTDADAGEVTFTPSSTMTTAATTWNAEYEILFADGGIETVPNSGYVTIEIVQDLG